MNVNIEGKDLELNETSDFLFGYDFTPVITGNTYADKNITYEFKRWTRKDKCDTEFNICKIEGKYLRGFLQTNTKCDGLKVFLMERSHLTQHSLLVTRE